ncbi:spermatogenesis- and oogenesis-specific basic helix-loop-helix-containing protein 1 [Hemicordylus capensis]|uniref:spermatogenesis- and oogenesis-specific basic helix-loop-helix-containing protein 1 n=1 Tax=Hemicordylus capensis TaxID=884348 RepID=UPI002302FDD1|nr:spermatogenesis- and oogenesis-specific basic helix-loop-helix-containing protein 1 [Hemicordylus capensis]
MSLQLHELDSNRRNVLERRRRKRVTVSCEHLRKLLPAFGGRREDMASILEMTVEYLQLAHRHVPKDQRPADWRSQKDRRSQKMLEPEDAREDARGGTQTRVGLAKPSDAIQTPLEETEEPPSEQSLATDAAALMRTGWPRCSREKLLSLQMPDTRPREEFTPVGFVAEGGAVTSGDPRPPEEGTRLLCTKQDPSPLLSSASLSFSPGPSVQGNFLAPSLRSSPPSGLDGSASELETQGELLFDAAAGPGAGVEPEGGPSRELLSWLKEQERELLREFELPAEDLPGASWAGETSPRVLASLEEMERSFLEMYGLLAPDQEQEQVSGSASLC